jgi:hypothetical protein
MIAVRRAEEETKHRQEGGVRACASEITKAVNSENSCCFRTGAAISTSLKNFILPIKLFSKLETD